ncbi:hypothetical protein ABW21_db0207772 [Orbilia brochopaga]|nr:hypothetical protein ABW21_db0207772 [Drechslerella brochopaga]
MVHAPDGEFFTPKDLAQPLQENWAALFGGKDRDESNLGPNLWAKDDVLFARTEAHFESITPALRLASNILTRFPEKFGVHIYREDVETERKVVELDPDKIPLGKSRGSYQQDILNFVVKNLPKIELDPHDEDDVDCWASTVFADSLEKADTIMIKYRFLKPILNHTKGLVTYHQVVVASFYVAALILHELGHILEFRGAQRGNKNYQTPPGTLCRESGLSVELRLFGGCIEPIFLQDTDSREIRAVAIKSSMWGFHYMEIAPRFIEELFSPSTWQGATPSLSPPIQTIFRASTFMDDSESVFSGSDKYKRRPRQKGFLEEKLAKAKFVARQMNRKCGKGRFMKETSARAASLGAEDREVADECGVPGEAAG